MWGWVSLYHDELKISFYRRRKNLYLKINKTIRSSNGKVKTL